MGKKKNKTKKDGVADAYDWPAHLKTPKVYIQHRRMQTRLNTSRPIRDSCVFVASYIIVSVIFYFFPYIGGVLLSVNVEGKQLGSIINAFRSAIIIGAVERKKKIWESVMPFFAFLMRFHKAGRKSWREIR